MATRKKAAPVEEVDELEELDDEELELEDEDEAPAPKKKKAPAKKAAAKKKAEAEDDVWGVRDLIALIKEEHGKDYNPREVRALLRKLARDGSGRVDREIIAGNKSRYSWSGPEDPEVLAVLAAVGEGEIEASKKEALDKLKADKAKKTAAKKKAEAKKKPKPPVDEDDDELEELDDEDED